MSRDTLAENVVHFARVLRAAGLRVGPDKVIDAVHALEIGGVRRRDDFYWTLNAVFLDRHEQQPLFDQAFHIFWRDPRLLDRIMHLLLPKIRGNTRKSEPESARRLGDALFPAGFKQRTVPHPSQKIDIDASFTFSEQELLQTMDFETMSAAELAQAKAAIARLRLPVRRVPTRRYAPSRQGNKVDMRATLRASLRSGSALIRLHKRAPVTRHPPLVILCDISGSMNRYSRMFLRFLHALTGDRDRVYTFVFGTRLTNITRYLRHSDVDVALGKVSTVVQDWAGGTRIGKCLHEFNRHWSRRVLGQGAVVLLISDGLDRDVGAGLEPEIERLHKSCRRLIWLNPLLRYEGFEAKPAGVKAMLPHVDDFRPVHNLQSLVGLAKALTDRGPETARRVLKGAAAA